MVLDAVANFVRGNTDAAVDNSQTTISVVDASIFPDPSVQGEYNVVIWDAATYPRPDQDPDTEILRVTAIDTTNDDLTVVRAQETTTAAAHPDGSAIHLSPTAKMFSDIESEYTASGENFDGEGTSEFSNLQSVSTNQQIVGGSVRAEKLDEFVQSESTTSTVDVEFTGLSNRTYLVEFAGIVLRDSGVVDLTVNGVDGGGNGSYTYFDETGTKQTGVDAIELLNNTSFVRPLGTIMVRQRNNRLGVKPMLGAGEMVNLNGFAQAGGADSNVGSLSSIKLSFTGGLTDNDVIRLWRGF